MSEPDPVLSQFREQVSETDRTIPQPYSVETVEAGKAANKAELQRRLGLPQTPTAPVLGLRAVRLIKNLQQLRVVD